METLLRLIFLVAFPLATGAGSYFICRQIKRPFESFIQFVVVGSILLILMEWVVATTFNGPLDLGIFFIDVDGHSYLFFLLLLTGTLLNFGGHADVKVAGPVDPDWFSSHFLLYAATMASFVVGAINVAVVNVIFGRFLSFLAQPSSWMVYLLLLTVSPSLTPLLIQFKQWLEEQPGFRTIK